ncbi:AraC family transcriptional regulator [Aquirhabdus sp.]|uniref:AraC family transcriptional regulator n=1 Tax=Aquirhabdus sp. TaxID=2824160 RepID=UPI00396C45EF
MSTLFSTAPMKLDCAMVEKSKNPHDYQHLECPASVMPKSYQARHQVDLHQHERGQLIYATSGIMELSTKDELWLIPPRFGVWIPAYTPHKMTTKTNVDLNTLFVDTQHWNKAFPTEPCGVEVSSLLHELLIRAASFPIEYSPQSVEWKTIDLLVEELQWTKGISLLTPAPSMDKRLQDLCHILIINPSDNHSLEEWSSQVGATTRTLSRLFKQELNTTFSLWRQQLRIVHAIPSLMAGKPMSEIAHQLGYSSQSTFTVMFKKIMGKTPTDYIAWANRQSAVAQPVSKKSPPATASNSLEVINAS